MSELKLVQKPEDLFFLPFFILPIIDIKDPPKKKSIQSEMSFRPPTGPDGATSFPPAALNDQ